MKFRSFASLAAIFLGMAPFASASLYQGSWTNKTFETSGPLSIAIQTSADQIMVNLDLDGPVFGEEDPDAVEFAIPLDELGNGNFSVAGTPIGDLSGTFTSDGHVTVHIRAISVGFIRDAAVEGTFDLLMETFEGTYEINSELGPFAEGELEAHVHKAPSIHARKTIRVRPDRTARLKAIISSNVPIRELTAEVKRGKAKVRITGTGPYRMIAKRVRSKRTVILIKALNADGETGKHRVILKSVAVDG